MPFKRNDETRNRIIDASLECFLEKGFSGTTVVEIGKRAGINKALVYYYFSSKEILLQQLIEHHLNKIISSIEEYTQKNLEDDLSHLIEFLKRVHHSFLSFLLREIVVQNSLAVDSLLKFLDDKNVSLQSILNRFLNEKRLSEISSLHNRELLIAVLGIFSADLMFQSLLEPFLNVKNSQLRQFYKNYNEIARFLLRNS